MTAFNYEMMAALLRETEQQHAIVEKILPKHEWQDWYAVYLVERMKSEQVTRENAKEVASMAIRAGLDMLTMDKVASQNLDGGVTILDGEEAE